jgi:hypothetical protein
MTVMTGPSAWMHKFVACGHERPSDRRVDTAMKAQHLVFEPTCLQARIGAAAQAALDPYRRCEVFFLKDRLLDQSKGLFPVRNPSRRQCDRGESTWCAPPIPSKVSACKR